MAFLGEAGEFGVLQVKEKWLVSGEVGEEVIELDLNRGWVDVNKCDYERRKAKWYYRPRTF